MARERGLPGWAVAAILIVVWEVVGRLGLVASGALPAPSAILVRFWADRADYPAHVWATLQASTLGFLAGNAVAVLAGVAFVLSPRLLRLARGTNIAIFALPPIAIAPILALTLEGIAPRVVLAALGVYFVTMSATVIGLTQYDARAADLVRAYGGGRGAVLRLVQLRGAVPAILSGFRVAAPNAVLGAILAEFGGGGRWGLGAYLLGSLGRADPARLWGIGLVATLIAGASYALFAVISARTLGSTRAVSLNPAAPPRDRVVDAPPVRLALAVGSVLMPFLIWWAFLRLLSVPAMLGKTPLEVFAYVFVGEGSAVVRAKLLAALAQTLPITVAGMALGHGLRVPPRRHLAADARLHPGVHAGGARHPDDAAGRADAAPGADARPRRGGDALDHRIGHLLPGLRDDRPGAGAGAARHHGPAARLRRRGASRVAPRLDPGLDALDLRRDAADRAARAPRAS